MTLPTNSNFLIFNPMSLQPGVIGFLSNYAIC